MILPVRGCTMWPFTVAFQPRHVPPRSHRPIAVLLKPPVTNVLGAVACHTRFPNTNIHPHPDLGS